MKDMKRLFVRIACVAALLALSVASACAEPTGIERFLGAWGGDGVSVQISQDGEELRCLALLQDGDDERDAWQYCACWYDEAANAVVCGGVVKTHQRFSGWFQEWEEADWSTSDLYYARFEWAEDGSGLVWTDDGLDAPVALTRTEADAAQETGAEASLSPYDFATTPVDGGRFIRLDFPKISLLLPASWEGQFTAKRDEFGVAFYQTASYDRFLEEGLEDGGFLFRLCASEDEGFRDLLAYAYLGYSESAGLHFYLTLPPEYTAYQEDAIMADYNAMAEDVETIIENARITP